jgi:hypothetical protein
MASSENIDEVREANVEGRRDGIQGVDSRRLDRAFEV